ncbi:hypothetical protein V2J09_005129 [Rumex salicifolius]
MASFDPNSKVPQFGSWTVDDNIGYTAYFETARKGKPGGPLVNPNDPQMNRDVPPPFRPTPQARPTKPESKQPKFGEWDEEEDVPYTAYFENPRKGVTNPNDPQMNRDLAPPARPKEEPKQPKFGDWDAGEEVPYTAYFEVNARKGKTNPNEPQMNRDVGPTAASKPVSRVDNVSGRSSGSQPQPNAVKFSGGPRSVEQSPIHPRAGGRGGGGSQPSSFDSVQGTPGRAKPKTPLRGAQNPVGGGASIPAFGDWNKNPSQADGYTVVFDQLQKDRRGGPGTTPSRDASSTPYNNNNTPGRKPKITFAGPIMYVKN